MTEKIELMPCPWCRKIDMLAVSIHQARDKKHRYGHYDSSVYCRRCGVYGPRMKSEQIINGFDYRNCVPTHGFRERMRQLAVEAWNRRTV